MVTHDKNGSAQFAVYLPNASKVELIGDFTGWFENPRALHRDGKGWWRGRAELPSGDYLFCYLVDGIAHIPDFAAHGVRRNGNGGWVSQLRIDSRRVAPGEQAGAQGVLERAQRVSA